MIIWTSIIKEIEAEDVRYILRPLQEVTHSQKLQMIQMNRTGNWVKLIEERWDSVTMLLITWRCIQLLRTTEQDGIPVAGPIRLSHTNMM